MRDKMQCSKYRGWPTAGTQSSLGLQNEGTGCIVSGYGAWHTEFPVFVAASAWVPRPLTLVGLFCRAGSVRNSSLIG